MINKQKIGVLQVCVGGPCYGGVEKFLLEYYSYFDKSIFTWDFLFCNRNALKAKAKDDIFKGSLFYELNIIDNDMSKNTAVDFIRLFRTLRKLMDEHPYDIVHVNTGSIIIQTICALAFRKYKKIIKISHSHSSPLRSSYIKEKIFDICRIIIVNSYDYLLSCSSDAGRRLYGNNCIKHNNYRVIKNAINADRFLYSEAIRREIRKKNRIEDHIIYSFVGRLDNNKNPFYLIDVFSGLVQRNEKARLWIIGDGELRQEVESYIKRRQLSDYIWMLGNREDVAQLLQAADALIFPSKHEGLSLVIIEAQAAGLPVFAADSISREHDITGLISFIPLDKGSKKWADIISNKQLPIKRESTKEQIDAKGYNIVQASKSLQELYLEAIH